MATREYLEIITGAEGPLAYIIDGNWLPQKTEFLTPESFGQQMGMIVYGAGNMIAPHIHRPVIRSVVGTTECVIVRSGACTVDIFSSDREKIASRDLKTGDIILLVGGGHGFHIHEDTVLFEVKQGPYAGDTDKERF